MSLSDDDRARILEEERVRAAARAQAEAELKQKQTSPAAKGCLGCLGAAVISAVLFALVPALLRDNGPAAQAERELSNARPIVTTICETEVERRLRSPATADYPFGHVTAVQRTGPTTYRLASYVDAQNGFGAIVRTNFVCDVTGSGSEVSDYRLSNLAMQ